MPQLTIETLKKLLKYDKDTGVFRWLVSRARTAKAGQIAGWYALDYLQITINGKTYKAHRLAWFYMTERWPKKYMDHINSIKDDNRWINLREATRSQNGANRKTMKNNALKIKGIYARKRLKGKTYIAQIKYKNKVIHLGCFPTKQQAHTAYCTAAKKLHGEFAHYG